MNTSYTPGPWAIAVNNAYKTSWLVLDGMGNQLAQVANWQNVSHNTDAPANARLIASAPDLLDELEAMTDAYAKAMQDAGVTRYPEALAVVRNARQVIAKAKGGA